MALFEIDRDQFDRHIAAIEQLSDNIAKWQAEQTMAVQSGFTALIAALTGADVAEIQERINAFTETARTEADALEQAATKVEGE